PRSLGDRGDDLLDRPVAEPGLLIGRRVRPVEHAEPRKLKTDGRAAKVALHVRLADKAARRVTVGTRNNVDEILAALNLRARACGLSAAQRNAKRNGDKRQ